MLIKWSKIQYLDLDKTCAFPRNQVTCLKNWKFWRALTTMEFNIFCWNFAHVSVLRMSKKGCVGFFFILFRSWVIDKLVFCEFVETSYFLISENKSSSKQSKKNSTHPFVVRESVQNFCKNYKVYGSWSSSKFSIFQTKCLISRKR